MSFCLYISARVFVQYLKSRPDDSTVYSSLQFVISALNAMKNKNPLTESFLVQLDVDLEGTGIKAMENAKYTFAHTAAVIVSSVISSLSLLYLQPNIMILPSSNHIARVR